MVTQSALSDTIKTQKIDLTSFFEKDIKHVDVTIANHLQSPIPLVSTVAQHLIYAGGKRLRPLLALASHAMINPVLSQSSFYLAAAVEFIHTATLLHDDVVDESHLRRGLKSAHKIWGNQASILVGDFLFAQAFQLMVKCESLAILDVLSKASAVIAEGEVLQLSLSHDLLLSKSDYLRIISAKTAELFSAASHAGALSANGNSEQISALQQYGYNLGMAFQITDDILDYLGIDGKTPGDDFREGKVTLPVILTLSKCSEKDRLFWDEKLIQLSQTDTDLKEAIKIINNNNGFQEARALSESYAKKACDTLRIFPQSDLRTILEETARHASCR